MNGYDERIINEFPMEISRSDMASTPDGNNIFDKGKRKIIGKKESEEFHTSYSTYYLSLCQDRSYRIKMYDDTVLMEIKVQLDFFV